VSEAVVIAVRVTPRGGRDEIEGVDDAGELRLRVSAPPADGAANKAAARLLAEALGVPRSTVSVTAGAASRHKRLRVEGVDAAAVLTRWPGARVRAS
jgi:uncharacterized protein (TIGR00251 family)